MQVKKYSNLYSKTVYVPVNSDDWTGEKVNEIQLKNDGCGLIVLTTNGYRYFSCTPCKTIFEAKDEMKRLYKLHKAA